MTVQTLMTTAPITVPPDTTIVDARALMQQTRIRHLLVVGRDGRLAGIVTDRDIRLNLPSPATSLSVWEINYLLARLTVAEVMTSPVTTIGPDHDAGDAANIMLDRKIGALPIVVDGRPIGILTETDLVRAFAQHVERGAAVAARMTP